MKTINKTLENGDYYDLHLSRTEQNDDSVTLSQVGAIPSTYVVISKEAIPALIKELQGLTDRFVRFVI